MTPKPTANPNENAGEVVWDLALIQRLLEDYPLLTVTGVIGEQVVPNDANEETLRTCLDDQRFSDLDAQRRFSVYAIDKPGSSVDLRFCSPKLLKKIDEASSAYVKGVSSFETMQELSAPCYYGFVVHSLDSEICTGLSRNTGIFVRVPAHTIAYRYRRTTLQNNYLTFNRKM